MRKSLALAVAVALLAACADSTSPVVGVASAPGVSAYVGHVPPPPASEVATVSTSEGAFTLSTTYFLNDPGTAGFLHFSSDQAAGVDVSSGAQIKYRNGGVTGQGVIQATVPDGLITIDLAHDLTGATFNGSCDQSCGSISFTGTFTSADGESQPIDGTIVIGTLKRGE